MKGRRGVGLVGVFGMGKVDWLKRGSRKGRGWGETYPAYDLVVVGEVRLAVLAAVDALGVQVDVVGEAHGCGVGLDGPAWLGRLVEVM